MFKLPLLQPHLTGSNGVVENKHGSLSKYSPFFSTSHKQQHGGGSNGGLCGAGGVDVKDWESQAADVMADVTNSDKYKSLALQAEVKLAEALERCGRLCVPSQTSSGEERPNKLRTAVCCQLLGEFSEMCGPFSNVLRNIRDELVRSVYSDIYTTELGTLSFDQLPWFTVAERLEVEKRVMLAERERFTEMLHLQQETVARIEEQMVSYQRATQAAQLEAGQLRSRLDSMVASEEQARTEARTGREELKRLRKEWLRMRDELELERDAHRKLKEAADEEDMSLKEQVSRLGDLLRRAEAELEETRTQLASRLPPESVVNLQETLAQLQVAAAESQSKIQALEEALAAAQDTMGTMTPRPAWASLRKYGIEEPGHHRTQDVVSAVIDKLAVLAAAARKADELEKVLGREDPAPAEVKLTIITDASAYFITEGDSSPGPSGTVSAEALGRGPHVPRCLRRCAGEIITDLPQLTQEDTEAQVMHIWKEKQAHDMTHTPEHLQSYLYHHLRQECSAALQGSIPTPSSSPAHIESQPGALHHAITQRAYALYHAFSCHSRSSPTVSLFLQVLSGQLPEAAFEQQQQVFTCLLFAAEQASTQTTNDTAAVPAIPEAGEDGNQAEQQPLEQAQADRLVPTAAMLETIQQLCHQLPSYKMSRLQEAYKQAVGETEVPLSHVRALFQPLGCCCSIDAQAANLQQHLQAVAEWIAKDELEISLQEDESGRQSPHPIPTTSHTHDTEAVPHQPTAPLRQPEALPCLSNGFVSMLQQLLLEHHEAGALLVEEQVLQAAVSAPDPGSGGESPSQHRSKDVQRKMLVGHISPAALAQALQAAGISEGQAQQMSASVSGLGNLGRSISDHQPLFDQVMNWCTEKCWAGLALARLKSERSLTVPGFPDLVSVLARAV